MTTALALEEDTPPRRRAAWRRHPTVAIGLIILAAVCVMAIVAPWLATLDPTALSPAKRLRPPSPEFWFGTDMMGRDVWSRTVYGARVSVITGLSVAALATTIGLVLGLLAGFDRTVDAVLMRIMDGLMAIPAILLAIALMALTRASLGNVIIAIVIAEVPRVVRLARGIVLTLRDATFVEAATASGTGFFGVLFRHILPNAVAPLVVQSTYIAASAMITEAILSFIGAGVPSSTPSWGNMMAEGRTVFQVAPQLVLFPGLCLSATVLAINMLGDGLRDMLDPRLARRVK
ncbi:ABC transporter permease [Reyranella sp. CPCC 100927]|uniref:ABC transporter permease n=1 Tax=Reyranella sp. CPCC 100927 TaxID=2599616 RepID=UPI0011B4FDD5|nr:ABC transporter permease [Reyranella sp. CPCC 100927]TWS99865.1 ABC transporter permease [Reyranella sp. CPCC 100927]